MATSTVDSQGALPPGLDFYAVRPVYAENADPTPELKAKVITGGGLVVADIDCIKGFIYVFCQTGILTLSLIRSRFFIGKGCLPPLRDELRQGQVVIDRLHRDEQNVSSTETCDSGADHVDPQDLKSFSVFMTNPAFTRKQYNDLKVKVMAMGGKITDEFDGDTFVFDIRRGSSQPLADESHAGIIGLDQIFRHRDDLDDCMCCKYGAY